MNPLVEICTLFLVLKTHDEMAPFHTQNLECPQVKGLKPFAGWIVLDGTHQTLHWSLFILVFQFGCGLAQQPRIHLITGNCKQ
jgi:hypothetical protein